MKTKISITGDSILMAPFPESYTGMEAVKSFIGQGDVRINNLEMVISNNDCFASTYCGGIWLTAVPERLDDVCKYGFNCFGFANNHTMDFSYKGLESTLAELQKRGMPVCGAGQSLEAAPSLVDAHKYGIQSFMGHRTTDIQYIARTAAYGKHIEV